MNDILSAIGVILVFLTFLLGSIQREISAILEEKKPEASQVSKIEIYNSKIKKIFYVKSLPISIIFLVISYLLIPSCVKIFKDSQFEFWSFDVLNTTFIFVEMGLMGMTIFSIFKTVELALKM